MLLSAINARRALAHAAPPQRGANRSYPRQCQRPGVGSPCPRTMPPRDSEHRSVIREPLSFAMGTRGKVGCLRVLALIPGPSTQRELARRARFQHRTVKLALEDLVACGVVARIEGSRDFLVSLNHEHRLAPTLRELFRQEAEHFLELRPDLVRARGASRRP